MGAMIWSTFLNDLPKDRLTSDVYRFLKLQPPTRQSLGDISINWDKHNRVNSDPSVHFLALVSLWVVQMWVMT
jgi:hypothetical protein